MTIRFNSLFGDIVALNPGLGGVRDVAYVVTGTLACHVRSKSKYYYL